MVVQRMIRTGALCVAMTLGLAGCGDGDPAGPAGVTTIEITPSALSLEIGQTQRLTARVLDGSGQAIAGQRVRWSSSDTARLAVDSTGLVRARRSGTADVLAAAAGAQGAVKTTIRALAIRTEPAAATTARVGPAGGSITARAANGIAYTLEVPAGALFSSVDITVTPVTAIGTSPEAAGLRSAVQLQPAGLHFLLPVTVTVELPTAPDPADLIGFHFSDDGEELFRYPMFVSGRQLQFVLSHFSGVGGAAGAFNGLLNQPATPGQQSKGAIAAALAAGDVDAMIAAFRAWYLSPVRPLLSLAATEADVIIAWTEFAPWYNLPNHPALSAFSGAILTALATERAEAANLATVAVRTAINDVQVRCVANHDVALATRVLSWMRFAEIAGLSNLAASGIDRATILQNLCVRTDVELSIHHEPLRPAEVDTAFVAAELRFADGQNLLPAAPFLFETTLVGTSDDGTRTDTADGFDGVTRAIVPADTLSVTTMAEACMLFDAIDESIPICDQETITLNPTRLLHFDDFSNPTDSLNAATSPSGEKFYGELTSQEFTFTYDGIGDHTSLILEFDLYIIDSWNGNGGVGSSAAPDVIEVSLAGGATLLRTTFSNKPRDAQAYPGTHPGANNAAGTGSAAINSLGYPPGPDYFGDSTYRIRLTIPHTDDTITIRVGPSQTAPGSELWGIDNLRLSLGM